MKSSPAQLQQRGYIPNDYHNSYQQLNQNEILDLLQSDIAVNRTLAARLLKYSPPSKVKVEVIIKALTTEKKLYSKIEICETLTIYDAFALPYLLPYLGKIGKNQHNEVPEKDFGKKNYPLPRDIVARIISKMKPSVLPVLFDFIQTAEPCALSEAIDAIGFISFYNRPSDGFEVLEMVFHKHINNSLLRWKIYRACSAFEQSVAFLQKYQGIEQSHRLLKEVQRSLMLAQSKAIVVSPDAASGGS
ncbi:MAG: hypothetical protein ACEPOW_05415 [Bacteroidales bacterium]